MLESFIALVSVLLTLSISAERLVELFKGRISWLNDANPDPAEERKRQFWLHLLSVLAGGFVVWLAGDYVAKALDMKDGLGWGQGAGLALLASGGSSMWNTVLTYLLSVKNMKRQEERGQVNVDTAAGRGPEKLPSLPARMPASLGPAQLR